MVNKILLIISSSIITFFLGVFFLNFLYMYGIIDFYKDELFAYNLKDDLSGDNGKETILIMGDSFTAGNTTYPNFLRERFPNYKIINSSVAGSGIIQASTIAKRRIKKFNPSVFIYQIYVGNDLLDITYPINWKKISMARNIYWFISNNIRVTSYINYKFGQKNSLMKKNHQKSNYSEIKEKEEFSLEKYSKREIIYNKADNKLVENSILQKGDRKKDFELLASELVQVFKLLPVKCKKIILVLPHACQINRTYLERTIMLGAKFSELAQILKEEYPFIKKLRELFSDIIILNPLMVFRNEEKKGTKIYFANDEHLNKNGQKILVDYIAEYIKRT